MPLALELERHAQLRYDGEIPAEALAAIAAAEQADREAALTARLFPEAKIRFLAAKEFRLAKDCFRTLARLTRQGILRRRDRPAPGERRNAFCALRDEARIRAYPHLEALAALRHQQRRAP